MVGIRLEIVATKEYRLPKLHIRVLYTVRKLTVFLNCQSDYCYSICLLISANVRENVLSKQTVQQKSCAERSCHKAENYMTSTQNFYYKLSK